MKAYAKEKITILISLEYKLKLMTGFREIKLIKNVLIKESRFYSKKRLKKIL